MKPKKALSENELVESWAGQGGGHWAENQGHVVVPQRPRTLLQGRNAHCCSQVLQIRVLDSLFCLEINDNCTVTTPRSAHFASKKSTTS